MILHLATNGNPRPRRPKVAEVKAAQPGKKSPGAAMLSRLAWEEIGRSLGLSGRERQITRAIFDQQTECEMAAGLGISEHTVHTHLDRLHKKLQVRTRTEVVLRVVSELLFLTISESGSLPGICRHRLNGRCPLPPR